MLSSTEDNTSHHSSSSSSSSDREESEAETDRSKESDHEEPDAPPEERAHPNPEETSEVEPEDCDVQDCTEDSAEINTSDSTGPSGSENPPNADTSEVEKLADDSKQEEDQERGEWKSAITRTSSRVRTQNHF